MKSECDEGRREVVMKIDERAKGIKMELERSSSDGKS